MIARALRQPLHLRAVELGSLRPLPELRPATEWFWTSGKDGQLRIQGCADCGALVHPPVPVCQVCRSRERVLTVVSGRGTVVAFTVNEQRWSPAFEPPYAIANVALEEDPSVHLTTNVVGCDPYDVHVGQQVVVRFEQHDDVWLPGKLDAQTLTTGNVTGILNTISNAL